MMRISYSVGITDKAGRDASLTGSSELIDRIEALLEANGFKWNEEVECWDEGFYDSTPKEDRR